MTVTLSKSDARVIGNALQSIREMFSHDNISRYKVSEAVTMRSLSEAERGEVHCIVSLFTHNIIYSAAGIQYKKYFKIYNLQLVACSLYFARGRSPLVAVQLVVLVDAGSVRKQHFIRSLLLVP